ncbi:MAG: radical SAM protein [Candidatus Hodarchaeota archaeon]
MKYVYGPVPSRRLGNSLGIDLIPSKTCNYQCIYCQIGETTNFTNTRINFFPKEEIIAEIDKVIKLTKNRFDYVTFVGSGEPTLYKDLKDLIVHVKRISKKPVCVITNGSLLYQKEVQEALMSSDVVLPSLDAGDERSFIKINRPHPSINFENTIQGFIDFKKIFKGNFWIEVMLMKGINDSKEELSKIKNKIDKIKPDRIDINVPIRPPVEKWVEIPESNIFSILNEIFGDYSNIGFPEEGIFKIHSLNLEKELLSILERHPMREDQILTTFYDFGLNKEKIITMLMKLKSEQKISKVLYNEKIFWKLNLN